MTRPLKAIINLSAISHNLALLRERAKKARIIPVVKADAYGHGAVPVAARLEKEGVDMMAVSCAREALELSQARIKADIIVFGPILEEEIPELSENNFILSITHQQDFHILKTITKKKKLNKIRVLVWVDTGMGRLGFLQEQLAHVNEKLKSMPELSVIGLVSHFPVAESKDPEDIEYTKTQIEDFLLLAKAMKKSFKTCKIATIANSAGILYHPESCLDAARAGIALYGAMPSSDLASDFPLEPAMTALTKLVQIRELPKGSCVSYGRKTILKRNSRLGVLPVGYSNGIQRRLGPGFNFFVRAKPAPIMGNITMEITMIDLTEIPEAKPGDEVLILGKHAQPAGKKKKQVVEVKAETHAQAAGTIPYEILTTIGKLAQREYLE